LLYHNGSSCSCICYVAFELVTNIHRFISDWSGYYDYNGEREKSLLSSTIIVSVLCHLLVFRIFGFATSPIRSLVWLMDFSHSCQELYGWTVYFPLLVFSMCVDLYIAGLIVGLVQFSVHICLFDLIAYFSVLYLEI